MSMRNVKVLLYSKDHPLIFEIVYKYRDGVLLSRPFVKSLGLVPVKEIKNIKSITDLGAYTPLDYSTLGTYIMNLAKLRWYRVDPHSREKATQFLIYETIKRKSLQYIGADHHHIAGYFRSGKGKFYGVWIRTVTDETKRKEIEEWIRGEIPTSEIMEVLMADIQKTGITTPEEAQKLREKAREIYTRLEDQGIRERIERKPGTEQPPKPRPQPEPQPQPQLQPEPQPQPQLQPEPQPQPQLQPEPQPEQQSAPQPTVHPSGQFIMWTIRLKGIDFPATLEVHQTEIVLRIKGDPVRAIALVDKMRGE